MSDKVELRVDWCSHEAAKYAVLHWHYSRRMPTNKLAKLGVWEQGKFIGAVIFGTGAAQHIGSPYGLTHQQVCELVRVALNSHATPVSKIVSLAMKELVKEYSGLKLIVSYADTDKNHHGGIYQAMNWLYVGTTKPDKEYLVDGVWRHHRSANSIAGSVAGLPSKPTSVKHKYLYPLDRAMRKQIAPLAKPYPKRLPCGQSVEGDTSSDQLEEAGSIPAARS